MPKLYHVFNPVNGAIISSWKSHDEAVLAIRHLVNPGTVSPIDPAVRDCFQEGDDKDRYWAGSAHHPDVVIRHSVERGTAGESRHAHERPQNDGLDDRKLSSLIYGSLSCHPLS